MSLIKSANLPIGKKFQHFKLEDPNGVVIDTKEYYGKEGLIVAVMCNHCPYSSAIWERLNAVSKFAKKLDISTLAINPNIHPNYPEDSPSHMIDKIQEYGLEFPYLIDSDQKVAKSLGAVCTPEIFLFDRDEKLYYYGRIDDNPRDAKSVKNEELREAVMLLFSKQNPPKEQYPSEGCSIKWIDTVTG